MRIKDRPRRNCRNFVFWESQPTYLKEGKPVVRIRKIQGLESYLVAVIWPRAGHWGLRDSPTSISQYCAWAKKVRKEAWLDEVYVKLASTASHRRDFKVILLFHLCAERWSIHIGLFRARHMIQWIIQECINFFFRMESLELQAPGSSPIMLRLRQSDWYYSVLWWFNKTICKKKKSLTFCWLVFRTFCHPPFLFISPFI